MPNEDPSNATPEPPEDDIVEAVLIDDTNSNSVFRSRSVNVGEAAIKDAELVYSRSQEQNNEQSASHQDFFQLEQVQLPNYAAIGGAVTSVFLGSWSIIAGLLTPWSILFALIGGFFGTWGLFSPRRKLAVIGLCLSAVGVFWNVVRPVSFVFDQLEKIGTEEVNPFGEELNDGF